MVWVALACQPARKVEVLVMDVTCCSRTCEEQTLYVRRGQLPDLEALGGEERLDPLVSKLPLPIGQASQQGGGGQPPPQS
jgi:hypothetical protein